MQLTLDVQPERAGVTPLGVGGRYLAMLFRWVKMEGLGRRGGVGGNIMQFFGWPRAAENPTFV